jgi:hypothetical protein
MGEDTHQSTTPDRPSDATIDRLATAVELASKRPWLLMWRAFLQGFMTALGATIGTALFFTIIVWIFQRLGGIELLRPQIEKLQNLILPAKFQQELNGSAQSGYQPVLDEYQLTLR